MNRGDALMGTGGDAAGPGRAQRTRLWLTSDWGHERAQGRGMEKSRALTLGEKADDYKNIKISVVTTSLVCKTRPPLIASTKGSSQRPSLAADPFGHPWIQKWQRTENGTGDGVVLMEDGECGDRGREGAEKG